MVNQLKMTAIKNLIKMKKLFFYICYVLTLSISAQTIQNQESPLDVFHDTSWEWSNSEYTLELYIKDAKALIGDPIDGSVFFIQYNIFDISTGNIIYQTRDSLIDNKDFGGLLGSYTQNTTFLYGSITDNSNTNHIHGLEGMLKLTYIPCQGTLCNPQLHWELKKPKELLSFQGAPDDYNLPTDIILTKVN